MSINLREVAKEVGGGRQIPEGTLIGARVSVLDRRTSQKGNEYLALELAFDMPWEKLKVRHNLMLTNNGDLAPWGIKDAMKILAASGVDINDDRNVSFSSIEDVCNKLGHMLNGRVAVLKVKYRPDESDPTKKWVDVDYFLSPLQEHGTVNEWFEYTSEKPRVAAPVAAAGSRVAAPGSRVVKNF